MTLEWLTSARAKSIATVVAAVVTGCTALFGALKPPDTTSSAKAYELLRTEVVAQRAELLEVHGGLAKLDAWFEVWREVQQDQKSHNESVAPLTITAKPTVMARRAARKSPPVVAAVTVDAAEKSLSPPPPMPSPPPPRAELPKTSEVF